MFVGNPRKIGDGVARAVKGASWVHDPADMPPQLRSACRAVEFGNFPAAKSAITKGLNSDDPKLKQAAQLLHDVIQKNSGA